MSRLDDLLAGRHLIRSSLNLDAPAPAVERVDFEAVAANVRQQQLDDKVTAIKLANAQVQEPTAYEKHKASFDKWLLSLGGVDAASKVAVLNSISSVPKIFEAVKTWEPTEWKIGWESFKRRFWPEYTEKTGYKRPDKQGTRKIIEK